MPFERDSRGDAGRACLRDPARTAADGPESNLVWGLIASLFIGNTLLLLLNLPLAPLWAKLLRIPRPYLYAGILFFASMGAYCGQRVAFRPDLAAGIRTDRFQIRRWPAGPPADRRRDLGAQGRAAGPACALSSGDVKGLFGSVDVATGEFRLSAVAIVVYAIIVVILLWPLIFKAIRKVLPA